VRSHRLAASLRQVDFIEHGITQSQLSLIENGDLEPSPMKINVIAGALNLPPRDLVVGTELESRYDASESLDRRSKNATQTIRFMRSQRLVAAEEAYRRIQRFLELFCVVDTSRASRIDEDAHYQFAVRIYRRAIDEAKEFDRVFADHVLVIPSIIGDLRLDAVSLQTMLHRSKAYLNSLILEYPEADNAASRQEIVAQTGLDRIDRFLDQLLQ
jgi:transcriptional regulator with XRE-family HTH domain